MAAVLYEKGTVICKAGERMKNISLIVKGYVSQNLSNVKITLEAGYLIGLMDAPRCEYQCDYVAIEDTTVYSFPYEEIDDLNKIFTSQQDYASVFLLAALKQMRGMNNLFVEAMNRTKRMYFLVIKVHKEYQSYCEKYGYPEIQFNRLELLQQLEYEKMSPQWQINYYCSLAKLSLENIKVKLQDSALNVGIIFQAGLDMTRFFSEINEMERYTTSVMGFMMNSKKNDLLYRLTNLYTCAPLDEEDSAEVVDLVCQIKELLLHYHLVDNELINNRIDEMEEEHKESKNLLVSNQGSNQGNEQRIGEVESRRDIMSQILEYANIETIEKNQFCDQILKYKSLTDVFSTEDDVRSLRKEITKEFYHIYKEVVKKALKEEELIPAISLFLYFGYMDLELAGEEAFVRLLDIIEDMEEHSVPYVYNLFEWLKSIYHGENEPSYSELDETYEKKIREELKKGKITDKEADVLKKDAWAKVEFELDHMFQSTNKVTYGKIITFFPILCEHDLNVAIDKMLVTGNKIKQILESLRKVDYSLFYREVLVNEQQRGEFREFINVEVIPNIILMPNAGSRGIMWQPTGDIRNNSPARFMLPILTMEDVNDMLIGICARYRWEICKKIQGSRWNDITEPSLTSEYSDYIQYYKKNFDLSQEAKDRIHSLLIKGKNNYREVFVSDYFSWVKYEAKGSFRMNKVARKTLFHYCPFSVEVRKSLNENPMFRELFDKYEIFRMKKLKKAELVYERYQKNGGIITEELKKNMEFLKI